MTDKTLTILDEEMPEDSHVASEPLEGTVVDEQPPSASSPQPEGDPVETLRQQNAELAEQVRRETQWPRRPFQSLPLPARSF